jgi:folate-dependent phosphoribosylglycinamide formyltransferase PurN
VPVFRGDSVDDLKARVRAREKEFVVETLEKIAMRVPKILTTSFPEILATCR